ncbi:MAG: SDR family NAD(P)-dependent oxidoreductase [Acidimicrobiales bacterium]
MTSGRLAGKRALITGGGRGIGFAIARAFIAEGARCAITSRSLDAARTAADSLGSDTAIPVACDVTSDPSVTSMVDEVVQQLGGVDIVVNNAGGAASGPFASHSATAFLETFDLNVAGAVRVIQAFLPDMVERGQGRIVNIASTAGLFASPGQSPYNTSKHALVGLSKCLALELASTGVTSNAICPGFVETDLLSEVAEFKASPWTSSDHNSKR